MSNYQQLCWIHITIIAIIVCSLTGSTKNDSNDHPPVIVGFPDFQDIYLNNQNEMNCFADGLQPIKYTWFLNDTMITNTSVFVVKRNGTLVIKANTNENYTGTYRCIARNDIGKARSRDIHAHVAVFKKNPGMNQNVYPVLNYPFVLNCSKDLVKFSRPWPPKFKWTNETSTPFKIDEEGALVFSYFRDTDPKRITCDARNEITKEKYTLQYRLNYTLEVQGHQGGGQKKMNSSLFYKSTDQTVLEGNNVLLYCVFHDSPDSSMKWTKDGEDRPGENSPTLKIINAISTDAGSYKCTKDNSSHVIQVIVDAPSTIKEVENTTNNRVRVGDTANFSCPFSGRPMPNITWLIDGEPITTKFSNPAQYSVVNGSTNRSDLVLFNVTYNATVICKASNKYRSQLSGSYVMASDVSETPEQLATEVTTETTVDPKYIATSTQNQQELRYDAVNGGPNRGQNDVANHLILAVALSVSASIIVTFVMVLVICFVLRRRNLIIRTVDTQEDPRQPPSFVENRLHPRHEYGQEEILMTSPQHEHGQEEIPLTSPQHEHEEIPLTSQQSSDS